MISARWPKVLVAIQTWNQRKYVKNCLDAVLALDYPDFEVAVVDNRSTDTTFEFIQEHYPKIHLQRHRENLGCGEGINTQFRLALEQKAEYLLSIEVRRQVPASILSGMMRLALENRRIGAVWGKGRVGAEDFCWKQNAGTSFLPGGICLFSVEAFKRTGYLDPHYFLSCEVEDWLKRMRQMDYIVIPSGLSPAVSPAVSNEGFDMRSRYYYETRNGLYFRHKYQMTGHVAFGIRLFGFALISLIKGRIDAASGIFWGWFDYRRGKRGRKEFRPFFNRIKERFAFAKGGLQAPNNKTKTPKDIHVYVDWNIGDEVMAISAYEALKKQYPYARIHAEVRFPDLLKAHPFVDTVNASKKMRADLRVNLHDEIRHRPRQEYLPEIAGVDTWPEPKIYLTDDELAQAQNKWDLNGDDLKVAICPEVGWLSKRWPRENWIRLAEYFQLKHRAKIYVMGLDGAPLPCGIDLIGKTSLREAAAVLAQCDLFFGNDSGPLYMALAVATPSVGIYGPLNPGFLYSGKTAFRPVWTNLECRGCWPDGRMAYPDHCPKVVPDCLTSVAVASVIEAGEELLTGRTSVETIKRDQV